MKRFMTTKFILAIKDVSSSDVDIKVLKNGYDEFATLLLEGKETFDNSLAYHNSLVYTRLELLELASGVEKKSRRIFEKND